MKRHKKNAQKKALLFVAALLLAVGVAALVQAEPVFAQLTGDPLGLDYGEGTNLGKTDPRILAAQIISVVLGLLGIITLVIIIYAGFRWMTSAGNEDSIDKAKKTLLAAVIGLMIVLMSYAITRYALQELYQATTGNAYGTPTSQYPF